MKARERIEEGIAKLPAHWPVTTCFAMESWGMSRETARKALRALAERGELVIVRTGKPGGPRHRWLFAVAPRKRPSPIRRAWDRVVRVFARAA